MRHQDLLFILVLWFRVNWQDELLQLLHTN